MLLVVQNRFLNQGHSGMMSTIERLRDNHRRIMQLGRVLGESGSFLSASANFRYQHQPVVLTGMLNVVFVTDHWLFELIAITFPSLHNTVTAAQHQRKKTFQNYRSGTISIPYVLVWCNHTHHTPFAPFVVGVAMPDDLRTSQYSVMMQKN